MAYYDDKQKMIFCTDEEEAMFEECKHFEHLPRDKRPVPGMAKYFMNMGLDQWKNR